jgi:hypothetical protein
MALSTISPSLITPRSSQVSYRQCQSHRSPSRVTPISGSVVWELIDQECTIKRYCVVDASVVSLELGVAVGIFPAATLEHQPAGRPTPVRSPP